MRSRKNTWNAGAARARWDARVCWNHSDKVEFGDFAILLVGWNRRCVN